MSQCVDSCYETLTIISQDSIFENMSHSQWVGTIRSKVQSSWNLHTQLNDLDFFILLSSLTGIVGNQGQANYAAGCTFQDALARLRCSSGQKAISIDLGLMQSIGVIAESESLQRRLDKSDRQFLAPIKEKEFLSLLDIFCDPERPCPSVDESQIAVGLVTPGEMLARSLEPPEMVLGPLFAPFSQVRGLAGLQDTSTTETRSVARASELFRQAQSVEEQVNIVTGLLVRKLARALSIQPDDVDADQPPHAFGVDSLVAVELRNWIAKEFMADVPVFEIMGGRSIAAIGDLVTSVSQMKRV